MEFKSTPFILCGAEQHSEVQVCLLLANNGFSSHLFAFSPFHSSNSQFRSIHFYHHHCHLYKFIWGFIFASISSCFVASSKNKLRANLRRLWCLRLLSVKAPIGGSSLFWPIISRKMRWETKQPTRWNTKRFRHINLGDGPNGIAFAKKHEFRSMTIQLQT